MRERLTLCLAQLYGRGTCDMKSGVACAIAVMRAMAAVPFEQRRGTLVVAAVSSEEDGGAGCLAAIREGLHADLCIIPEPTVLGVDGVCPLHGEWGWRAAPLTRLLLQGRMRAPHDAPHRPPSSSHTAAP